MIKFKLFILIFTIFLLFSGCGDDGPSSLLIKGTVFYKGKPLPSFVVLYKFPFDLSGPVPLSELTPVEYKTVPGGSYEFIPVIPGVYYIAVWENEGDWKNYPDYPKAGITYRGSPANPEWGTVESLPGVIKEGSSRISGTVVEYARGTPLISCDITLRETGQKTVTDEKGYFSFNNIQSGSYTLLSSKSGYAFSKAQNVNASDGNSISLELIQMPYLNSDWLNLSPHIIITGVNDGDTVNPSKSVTVSAIGINRIKGIYVKVGNKQGYPSFQTDKDFISFKIPSGLPPGKNYLHISAYDVNDNRSEITLNIDIPANNVLKPPALSPEDVRAVSYTMGQTIGEAYSVKEKMKKRGYVPQNFSGLSTGTICYVSINCKYDFDDATSYKLYRATDRNGNFTHVATSSFPMFTDGDPSSIHPGSKVYYKVSACNGGGEGPLSEISNEVAILDFFRVTLFEPSDRASDVSVKPSLKWNISAPVGDKRIYDIYIWDVNRGNSKPVIIEHITSDDVNETTVTLSGELERNRVYEWDVFNACAMGSYDVKTGTWCAYSYPTFPYMNMETGEAFYTSNNGSFTFSTR